MALFSRIDRKVAEELVTQWPHHYWAQYSVHYILSHAKNRQHISNVPLNDKLLESVQKNGFESPFLLLASWYPVCGSQRLRCALEMPEKWQKKTKVWVCRFTSEVYRPLFYWPSKEEGHKSVQQYFQMLEVVFKTLYMPSHDSSGIAMVDHEEYGNHMHWPARDGSGGKIVPPKIGAGSQPTIQQPVLPGPPGIAKNPLANAMNGLTFGSK